jgi:hypothetical protein
MEGSEQWGPTPAGNFRHETVPSLTRTSVLPWEWAAKQGCDGNPDCVPYVWAKNDHQKSQVGGITQVQIMANHFWLCYSEKKKKFQGGWGGVLHQQSHLSCHRDAW